jgi:hypothetical protein
MVIGAFNLIIHILPSRKFYKSLNMKKIILFYFIISFCSCITSKDKNRFYVKSIKIEQNYIDWFIYSQIGGFSKDYLSIRTHNNNTVFWSSFFISDIINLNDTLVIQLYKHDDSAENVKKIHFVIKVDTSGCELNSGMSRFERLDNSVIKKPHFLNSDADEKLCKLLKLSQKAN